MELFTNLASGKQEVKPTYDVGFWEYVYALELKSYLKLVERKALYLQKLENTDLFSLPEPEAIKINSRIKILSEELNTLYGMKLFMDEMKNCYLDSSDKIYNAYHSKNLSLEVENYRLKKLFGLEIKNVELHLNTEIKSGIKPQTLQYQTV